MSDNAATENPQSALSNDLSDDESPLLETVLERWGRDAAEDYERLRKEAQKGDSNKAGHGSEAIWKALFETWLPPGYGVGLHKYIQPEVGNYEPPETDIVVFRPAYPTPLRSHRDVMAGGVAAAFSVKQTLTLDGLRGAFETAMQTRRSLAPRQGTMRREFLPPFPFGVLSHSHDWRADRSRPTENIARELWRLQTDPSLQPNHNVRHPKELLDFVCVADLGTWSALRVNFVIPSGIPANLDQMKVARALAGLMQDDAGSVTTPIGSLLTKLLRVLSYDDPAIRPMVDGMRYTRLEVMNSGAFPLHWESGDLYSYPVLRRVTEHGLDLSDPEWLLGYPWEPTMDPSPGPPAP